MNKKLLAVAVAGALAAPGVALAQSSVTISGFLKAGVDNFKINSPLTTGNGSRAGLNTSENRVTDGASRILFNVVEDLGGGLQAVGQFDLRMSLDAVNRTSNSADSSSGTTFANNLGTPAVNALNGGNNHVGLRSQSWGSVRFGRQDTHYGNSGDTIPSKAGMLGAYNASVFDAVQRPGSSNQAIANLSRTPNLVWYDSPKWGGFTFMVGYSTNPIRTSTTPEYENDLSSGNRKGRGWTFNPVYNGGNWEVAWSHWDAKSDWSGCNTTANGISLNNTFTNSQGCNNANDDQKADSIRGHYIFPMGIRAGLAWNHSKTIGAPMTQAGGPSLFAGRVTGDRNAWAFPISYNMGAHTFYFTYTRAGNSKDVTTTTGVTTSGSSTGANLYALAYNYDLSKRTSVGVTYARLKNKADFGIGNSGGAYNTFYTGDSAFGGTNSTMQKGEGTTLFGMAMRHNF